MKKQVRYILLLVLLLSLALGSCTGEGNTDASTESETAQDTLPTDETGDVSQNVLPFIEDGKALYSIVSGTKSVAANETIQTFIKNVSRRTGATLTVGSALRPASGKEIVIGEVSNRETSISVSDGLFYDDFRVQMIDGSIYISLYHEAFLADALKEVEHALVKQDDKNWSISDDLLSEKTYSARDEALPLFETAGKLDGIYSCGDGDYEASFSAVRAEEAAAYEVELKNAGYTVFSENGIGENRFVTLYKEETAVYLSHYPSKSQFKVTFGKKGYLPEVVQPSISATVTPSLTQPARLGAEHSAPGMSYVIQTSDGGFILIDGGPTEEADLVSLLTYLKEKSPNGQKPVIHAWIFSHAHGDHMQLATAFLSKYSAEITLELVCANFPDFDTIRFTNESVSDSSAFAASLKSVLRSKYPNTPWYNFHTGQKFYLADAEVEILYTHEDFFPNTFDWGNDTSSAFRITLGNKEMIFLGDCDPLLCQFMADVYGSELKCDILQLSHHGFNGAVLDLYKACDPDICLWPVDGERFANDPRCLGTQKGYEFNAWIRDPSIKQREHYHASQTTILPLS